MFHLKMCMCVSQEARARQNTMNFRSLLSLLQGNKLELILVIATGYISRVLLYGDCVKLN